MTPHTLHNMSHFTLKYSMFGRRMSIFFAPTAESGALILAEHSQNAGAARLRRWRPLTRFPRECDSAVVEDEDIVNAAMVLAHVRSALATVGKKGPFGALKQAWNDGWMWVIPLESPSSIFLVFIVFANRLLCCFSCLYRPHPNPRQDGAAGWQLVVSATSCAPLA